MTRGHGHDSDCASEMKGSGDNTPLKRGYPHPVHVHAWTCARVLTQTCALLASFACGAFGNRLGAYFMQDMHVQYLFGCLGAAKDAPGDFDLSFDTSLTFDASLPQVPLP